MSRNLLTFPYYPSSFHFRNFYQNILQMTDNAVEDTKIIVFYYATEMLWTLRKKLCFSALSSKIVQFSDVPRLEGALTRVYIYWVCPVGPGM